MTEMLTRCVWDFPIIPFCPQCWWIISCTWVCALWLTVHGYAARVFVHMTYSSSPSVTVIKSQLSASNQTICDHSPSIWVLWQVEGRGCCSEDVLSVIYLMKGQDVIATCKPLITGIMIRENDGFVDSEEHSDRGIYPRKPDSWSCLMLCWCPPLANVSQSFAALFCFAHILRLFALHLYSIVN